MVGQVGVDPTMPRAADLQSAPFADSVLTHKKIDTSTVGISTLLMAFRRAAQTFPPHTSSKYLTSKHWLKIVTTRVPPVY